MCAEQTLCQAARFQERKAQEDGIAHASPYRAGYVARYRDGLNEYRIDTDANHNEKRLKTEGKQRFQVVLTDAAPFVVYHCRHRDRRD